MSIIRFSNVISGINSWDDFLFWFAFVTYFQPPPSTHIPPGVVEQGGRMRLGPPLFLGRSAPRFSILLKRLKQHNWYWVCCTSLNEKNVPYFFWRALAPSPHLKKKSLHQCIPEYQGSCREPPQTVVPQVRSSYLRVLLLKHLRRCRLSKDDRASFCRSSFVVWRQRLGHRCRRRRTKKPISSRLLRFRDPWPYRFCFVAQGPASRWPLCHRCRRTMTSLLVSSQIWKLVCYRTNRLLRRRRRCRRRTNCSLPVFGEKRKCWRRN